MKLNGTITGKKDNKEYNFSHIVVGMYKYDIEIYTNIISGETWKSLSTIKNYGIFRTLDKLFENKEVKIDKQYRHVILFFGNVFWILLLK